jgi:hypothetical protein
LSSHPSLTRSTLTHASGRWLPTMPFGTRQLAISVAAGFALRLFALARLLSWIIGPIEAPEIDPADLD